MIDMLLLALLAGNASYEPPPQVWYHQAVGCGASAMAEKGDGDPSPDLAGELMTWGLVLADTGRKAGRTRKQVDDADIRAAIPFYSRLKDRKPPAFAAHRSYCRALLEAERG